MAATSKDGQSDEYRRIVAIDSVKSSGEFIQIFYEWLNFMYTQTRSGYKITGVCMKSLSSQITH